MDLRSPLLGDCEVKELLCRSVKNLWCFNPGGYVRTGRGEEGSKPVLAKRLARKHIFLEKKYLSAFKCARLYKGSLRSSGIDRPVLVKRYDPQGREASIMYSTEINILSGLHHPNVVELIGYCEKKGEMLLVYEDLCLDFLQDRISSSSNEVLSWSERMAIAHGISKGLKCLHDNGVIFRDLRPYNILVDKDNNPKIFDFVDAQDSNGRGASMTEIVSIMGYLDPGSVYGRFSTKSDIYSFGFILLRLITGLDVWAYDAPLLDWVKMRVLDDNNGKLKECMDEQFNGIVDKSLYGEYTTGEVYQAVDLAISCMDLKEDRRPSIEVVVKKMSLVY